MTIDISTKAVNAVIANMRGFIPLSSSKGIALLEALVADRDRLAAMVPGSGQVVVSGTEYGFLVAEFERLENLVNEYLTDEGS